MTNRTPTHHDRTATVADGRDDAGYTMIELLFGVAILVIFVTASVLAVFEVRTAAANNECQTHGEQLAVAAERYLAETGNEAIEADGTDADRFERTLVDQGYLMATSPHHDLDADGVVISKESSTC